MGVTETDISIVRQYIKECVLEPRLTNEIEDFKTQSYSSWAAGEILNLLAEELMKPPPCVTGETPRETIDIIEEFAFTMDMYNEMSCDNISFDAFAVAVETADDLLYFYSHERGKLQ